MHDAEIFIVILEVPSSRLPNLATASAEYENIELPKKVSVICSPSNTCNKVIDMTECIAYGQVKQ